MPFLRLISPKAFYCSYFNSSCFWRSLGASCKMGGSSFEAFFRKDPFKSPYTMTYSSCLDLLRGLRNLLRPKDSFSLEFLVIAPFLKRVTVMLFIYDLIVEFETSSILSSDGLRKSLMTWS